jgi:hypothetical protein
MSAALLTPDVPDVPGGPVTSVAGAIARMEAIGAAFPAADGLACFARGLFLDSLAASTALASRMLLVAI